MLLFLDQENDAHADHVEAECRRRGVPFFRFCTERFPRDVRIVLRPDDISGHGIAGRLLHPEGEIDLADITGVWFRRPDAVQIDPSVPQGHRHFAFSEADETLAGLYRALADRRWVSDPYAIDAGGHKISQLHLARRLGFQVPRTIVTNEPDEALAFFAACTGGAIYKPLRFVPIVEEGAEHGIYTTVLDLGNVEEMRDSIRLTPCLFQELVEKSYELRVNVIGERVFAAAIHSQEQEETKIDFRLATESCRHEAVFLPEEIAALCLRITRELKLRMSNVDLIVTPGGDYVFLEVNPNGQWLWIEKMTGLPLTTALIDEMLGVDTLAGHADFEFRSAQVVPKAAVNAATAVTAVTSS